MARGVCLTTIVGDAIFAAHGLLHETVNRAGRFADAGRHAHQGWGTVIVAGTALLTSHRGGDVHVLRSRRTRVWIRHVIGTTDRIPEVWTRGGLAAALHAKLPERALQIARTVSGRIADAKRPLTHPTRARLTRDTTAGPVFAGQRGGLWSARLGATLALSWVSDTHAGSVKIALIVVGDDVNTTHGSPLLGTEDRIAGAHVPATEPRRIGLARHVTRTTVRTLRDRGGRPAHLLGALS